MGISKTDMIKSALVATAGSMLAAKKGPDEELGELLAEVQRSKIYDDGKTFVDLIPKYRAKRIQQEYNLFKDDPYFDLRDFVSRHFYQHTQSTGQSSFVPDTSLSVDQHINVLWEVLERRNRVDRGSLLALPYSYIVPGGRFSEQFYWDSYFVMLGLAADNKWDVIEGMVRNYSYMIRRFGLIPTANRSYFLSRSQPPFFALMVKLLARHKGRTKTYMEYLPYMLSEYRFWMRGRKSLTQHHSTQAYARVVQMPNGVVLNRYFDNKTTPRPESLREDTEAAANSGNSNQLYLDLRAGAESGWDFSSRWFRDPMDIRSIHTTDIIPVDLNSLLYLLETTIAEAYRCISQPLLAGKFQDAANLRAKTIQNYCWDDNEAFFVDYDFRARKTTGRLTLAAVLPLFAEIATSEQAASVAARLEADFLKSGGLVTTLVETGQQWDAPNGWAPLHFLAIEGLRNYGHHTLANTIKQRWIHTNLKVYNEQHKLIEKYDVTVRGGMGRGGEYRLQDGFGWTNGVLRALRSEPMN